MITFQQFTARLFSRPFFNTNFTVIYDKDGNSLPLKSCLSVARRAQLMFFLQQRAGKHLLTSRPAPQRAASLALQSDNFNFFYFFYFSSWVHFFGESTSPRCFIITLD
jgi:hypothetical protein